MVHTRQNLRIQNQVHRSAVVITHTQVWYLIASNDLQRKDKIAVFTSNPGMYNHTTQTSKLKGLLVLIVIIMRTNKNLRKKVVVLMPKANQTAVPTRINAVNSKTNKTISLDRIYIWLIECGTSQQSHAHGQVPVQPCSKSKWGGGGGGGGL